MRRVAALGVFICYVATAASAWAEPYTITATGELLFNAAFTTSGVFSCGALTPCTGSGSNTVTLGTATGPVTITFNGVTTSIALGNTATPVSLGTFTVAAPGSAFAFPDSVNVNVEIVGFALSMTQSSPVESTSTLPMSFGPGGGQDLPLLAAGSYFAFPAGTNPPGFHYTTLVYTLDPFPFSIRGIGTTDLQASAGATPEPASLLLVGSGLALAVRARRNQRRR